MRKLIILVAALALALTACASATTEPPATLDTMPTRGFPEGAVIGVAMPFRTAESFTVSEYLFNEVLTDAGFTPMIRYADGGVWEQGEQIEAMVEAGAPVIVVGARDGSQLGEWLAAAKRAGVAIIAFDRLLTNTPDVDAYIAFDRCQAGWIQAISLLECLAARKGAGPYNIKLIAGSPDDPNASVFFNCAMEVLQPKIDGGTLVIPSGQTTMEQVATEGWLPSQAKERLSAILSDFYKGGKKLDGILSPNDWIARGVIDTVEEAGFGIPIVTGQDSDAESVRWVAEGRQYSTINNDLKVLITETVNLVKQLQQGQQLDSNTTVNNGTINVPAFLLPPVHVTKDNVCTVYDPDWNAGHAAAETPLCKGE